MTQRDCVPRGDAPPYIKLAQAVRFKRSLGVEGET